MSRDPLVSAVIIFLDAQKFLSEAIASVFAQTYVNWELLLVDDGSRDASTDIARRQARQHLGKVRYLEHPGHRNLGMSASRNLGIRNSTGSYIAFLDADDVWFPDKLAEQVALMEAMPEAAMVYGPAQGWRSWTGRAEDLVRDRVQNVGVAVNALSKPGTLVRLFLWNEAAVAYPSSVLVRRESANRIGGFEDAFRGLYEDQVFFAKLCLWAPVYVADRVWCKYRIHQDMHTAVAERSGQYHPARRFFLEWLEGYLVREQPRAFALRSQVWRNLAPYRFPTVYQVLARLAFVKRSFRLVRRAMAIAEQRVAQVLR